MSDLLQPIQSNCVNICELDPTLGICKGCGRYSREISRWMYMSHGEREAIMKQCVERLDVLYGDYE